MIGKQVLAFGKSEKSEFINIRIFAASSGGRIGRFTPDRERSHVWPSFLGDCLYRSSSLPELVNLLFYSTPAAYKLTVSQVCHWVHSEDSDQTGRMPRLIWVFAGCTVILLVLSRGGSNIIIEIWTVAYYHNDLKFLDRQVWANTVDPDQTALLLNEQSDQDLHCLSFCLHL